MAVTTQTVGENRRKTGFAGWFSRRNLLIALLLVAAAAALATVLYLTDFDWRQVPRVLERVNRPVALLIMATLPIVGFPISVVYLAAGAIFGPWVGGAVVACVTLVHLLVTHALAKTVLRDRVEKWRKGWARRVPEIPKEENGILVAMLVVVPGLPYLARNTLMALARVPLRFLLGVGVPLYVARSYVTIFLGDIGNEPSTRAVIIFIAVFAAKLTISALLFRHIMRRSRPAA